MWAKESFYLKGLNFNLLSFFVCGLMWFILENIPCVLEKNVYCVFRWNVLHTSVSSVLSNGCCFLVDFLSGWSIHWCKWGVNVPYHYCITVSFSLYILSAPMLDAYFTIVISSCWIDLFITMKCPSLSFVTVFILQSILSNISIATPAFFLLPLAW